MWCVGEWVCSYSVSERVCRSSQIHLQSVLRVYFAEFILQKSENWCGCSYLGGMLVLACGSFSCNSRLHISLWRQRDHVCYIFCLQPNTLSEYFHFISLPVNLTLKKNVSVFKTWWKANDKWTDSNPIIIQGCISPYCGTQPRDKWGHLRTLSLRNGSQIVLCLEKAK